MTQSSGIKIALRLVALMQLLLANNAFAFTLQNPGFATRISGEVNSFSKLHMSTANNTIGSGIRLSKSPLVKKMPTYENNGPVTAVHSIGDFLDLVENTEENELVVVKYHAKWCKVCARATLKYKKMALKYAQPSVETPVPISFISVESTDNMKIIEQLGIKKFPFIQIYRNKECVAAFGTGPAHNFQRMVGSTVEQKLETTVEEWDAFRSEFKSQISSGLENLELLRLQSVIEEECAIDMTADICVSP